VFELRRAGSFHDAVNNAGPAGPGQVALYGKWYRVESARDNFATVTRQWAETLSYLRNGRTYNPFGGRNSNRFVFEVVTLYGGKIPYAAIGAGNRAPGLCGGVGIWSGDGCSGPRPVSVGLQRRNRRFGGAM